MSVIVSSSSYAGVLLCASRRYVVTTFYLICCAYLQRTQYPPKCVMVQIKPHTPKLPVCDQDLADVLALTPESMYKSTIMNIFIYAISGGGMNNKVIVTHKKCLEAIGVTFVTLNS